MAVVLMGKGYVVSIESAPCSLVSYQSFLLLDEYNIGWDGWCYWPFDQWIKAKKLGFIRTPCHCE
jgi:hypothetical protein